MGRILIVSKIDRIREYLQINKDMDVAFEINDFVNPDVLDNEQECERIINCYLDNGIPEGSTMHGAFFDVIPFSSDKRIREVSVLRMRQSLGIATRLGVSGIIFHTNVNPDLSSEVYDKSVVDGFRQIMSELLCEFGDINMYLENMFDDSPDILCAIAKELSCFDNFGVCLDWAHANIYGSNMRDWVKKLAPYVKHLHINDNDLKKDLHLAVGDGKIDWGNFARTYIKYFGDSSVLIETNEPKDQIRSAKYINDVFDKTKNNWR